MILQSRLRSKPVFIGALNVLLYATEMKVVLSGWGVESSCFEHVAVMFVVRRGTWEGVWWKGWRGILCFHSSQSQSYCGRGSGVLLPGRHNFYNGDGNWPSCSPGLSPPDYFVGLFQVLGLRRSFKALEDLRNNIRAEFDITPNNMLGKFDHEDDERTVIPFLMHVVQNNKHNKGGFNSLFILSLCDNRIVFYAQAKHYVKRFASSLDCSIRFEEEGDDMLSRTVSGYDSGLNRIFWMEGFGPCTIQPRPCSQRFPPFPAPQTVVAEVLQ
ncbi:hypothetical protein TNCV_4590961 [Trichonephila clavipes]|nr:hypothetical protein TNCV_4590961 [Trichonephila clavipes]